MLAGQRLDEPVEPRGYRVLRATTLLFFLAMKTILLIEDDEFIRDNTAELLRLAGYIVQPAANGRLGLDLALAARPDLVLCDIMMPVLDGYGVLQKAYLI
jgi:CheY-like chemotaxis protein